MINKELLRAENIEVSFGDQEVLNFDSFSLYEGERVGIVGVNGVGKTTFPRLLWERSSRIKGRLLGIANPSISNSLTTN